MPRASALSPEGQRGLFIKDLYLVPREHKIEVHYETLQLKMNNYVLEAILALLPSEPISYLLLKLSLVPTPGQQSVVHSERTWNTVILLNL